MHNPWKISTLLLAFVLVFQHASGSAHADRESLQSALDHLRSAAKSLEVGVGGKRAPETKGKSGGGSSAQAKALDLTRAAILQVETSLRDQ